MKRIYTRLLVLPLLCIFCICAAQTKHPDPFLSVGSEVSWDVRGSYKMGTGGSLKFGLPISQRSAISFSSGFTSFPGKTFEFQGTKIYNLGIRLLPVRIGLRYTLKNRIYLEPQAGYSRLIFERTAVVRASDFGAINYALNTGIVKNKHWDVSAQYHGFSNKNKYMQNFHSGGIRVAYNFNFKK